ncbi:hypothetical protein JD844_001155 [Phrynosoma platyrhinos]|uniref:G-protein coupled receptors family 3 profile domain-containing protein n=1 Tax=Phrynosoma platyrhinos TaxID=52577 RepID=A0ABQ7T959_PHRPL|nr:hypothetical protein JD844_001155 [Phrynosoma platyrhinos]
MHCRSENIITRLISTFFFTDTDYWISCSEEEYPNKGRDRCIPKVQNFLSIEESLGIILAFLSLFLSLVTGVVPVVFINQQHIHIVKAINQALSYILLMPLCLCFYSSLLSLVFFFVKQHLALSFPLLSSVLAKTIVVVVAFMSSKPGNIFHKWVGKRLAHSVPCGCSLVQVGCLADKFSSLPRLQQAFDHRRNCGGVQRRIIHTIKCTPMDPLPIPQEWHRPNEILIGGIASHIYQIFPTISFQNHPSQESYDMQIVMTKFYQHILALAFAVHEINEDSKILPNVTLGFHIYDSYSSARLTYRATLDLLCRSQAFIPNYKCGIQSQLIGVIGGLDSDISSYMAHILSLYKIPQVPPSSLCNDKCDLGYRKKKKEGKAFCCYDCVPCPKGKFANQTDMNDCISCSEEEYPNKGRDRCIPKVQNFLSIEESLGIILAFLSLFLSLVTAIVLVVFIKKRHTPIVKANNQALSYILLTSLCLCFLSSLLFLGKPNKTTCLLRQTAFGIVFSIAVSSVLAKTIVVVVAFMASKPGNIFHKWVGKRSREKNVLLYLNSIGDEGTEVPPSSLCNDKCDLGYRKKKKEGKAFYMNDCISCSEEEYPNKGRDRCIPKVQNFLSIEESLGIILAFLSLFLSLVTAIVLAVFIKKRHTPIVKANNQALSYILLTSLCLCFLSSLLFLGKPNKTTCLLRQTAFGIVFSIAVSSVLAKTIVVVVAFMASKPGNIFHKWVGKSVVTKFYQHILALVFSMDKINKNSKILPNITLGFHIYDSYSNSRMTYRTILGILFKSHQFFPSYKCGVQKNVMGVIGGLSSDTSSYIADIFAYVSSQPMVSEEFRFPELYHMVSNEILQYLGVIQLLLHFMWKWVGLIAVDDDRGDHFLQALEPMLSQNGICSESTERIHKNVHFNLIDMISVALSHLPIFKERKARVFVIYGESLTIMWLAATIMAATYFTDGEYLENISAGKVWITTAQTDFTLTAFHTTFDIQVFHGSLSFTIHSKPLPGFKTFLQSISPSGAKGDGFITNFWEQAFECSMPNSDSAKVTDTLCTGQEMLENLPASMFEMSMTGHSYTIYNSVYALAHALHNHYTSRSNHRAIKDKDRLAPQNMEPWKLHSLIQRTFFNNNAGDEIRFNEHGELEAGFDITNLVTFPNNSYVRVKVGRLTTQSPPSKMLTINEDKIQWHRNLSQVGK